MRSTVAKHSLFAAPPDDPRTRRVRDLVLLGASLFAVAWGAGLRLSPAFGLGTRLVIVGDSAAGQLGHYVFRVMATFSLLTGFFVVATLAVTGRQRLPLLRDSMVGALVAAAIAALGAAGRSSATVGSVYGSAGVAGAIAIAAFVAAVLLAGDPLTAPIRRSAHLAAGALLVSTFALGLTDSLSVLLAGAAGLVGAAAARLLFGTGRGIPGLDRVANLLAGIGVTSSAISYGTDESRSGVTRITIDLGNGELGRGRVYGRDAAEAAWASRAWRRLWYTDVARPIRDSAEQQVEHESLLLLHANARSASVVELITWGRGSEGDAVVVVADAGGQGLDELVNDELAPERTNALLDGCWDALASIHDAGIAHRAITPAVLTAVGDQIVFGELGQGLRLPDDRQLAADHAQMTVVTALVGGTDAALAAVRARLSDEQLLRMLPLIQTSVLPHTVRLLAKQADVDLPAMRTILAEQLGVDAPELAPLQRLSRKQLVSVLFTMVAVGALLSSLSTVQFDLLVEQLDDVAWGLVAVAFALGQLTNVAEYIALNGMVSQQVPFVPTIMFRYAMSYVSLAVPSDVGEVVMNVRYMQKLGVSQEAALAQGPLLTVVSKVIDVVLLIVLASTIGIEVDLGEIDADGALQMIVLLIVAVVVFLVLAMLVPRLRHRVLDPIRGAIQEMGGILRDPQRFGRVLLGAGLQRLLFSLALGVTAAAFGAPIGLGEALLVNSGVSLLVGLIPVPGGVGVGEAALAAGLGVVGVDPTVALAVAITHRISTAYLPPVLGWFCMRSLVKQDYL